MDLPAETKTNNSDFIEAYLRSQKEKAGIHYYRENLKQSVYIKNLRKKLEKKYDIPIAEKNDESLKVKVLVKEKKETASKKILSQGDFRIRVGDQIVNFSNEGIEAAPISSSDKEWLKNAQRYFVEAKENGKNIGSDPEYTSLNILYALWSTAIAYDLDPKRFLVQVYNESRFNPNLIGKAGERGIGQFKKTTAKYYGYDWNDMKAGDKTFAYQAKCSAELVSKVGETAYNGKGPKALEYKRLISKRLEKINRFEV